MHIWVDADACPGVIKDILFRAADRTHTPVTLIANQMLRTPPSPFIRAVVVPAGFDVADDRIAQSAAAGDLVITADIPLASAVIQKGASVLDPRGEWLTPHNIEERLTLRNFMETLRNSGVQTGGPAALSVSDRKAFANGLDAWLQKNRSRRTSAALSPEAYRANNCKEGPGNAEPGNADPVDPAPQSPDHPATD